MRKYYCFKQFMLLLSSVKYFYVWPFLIKSFKYKSLTCYSKIRSLKVCGSLVQPISNLQDKGKWGLKSSIVQCNVFFKDSCKLSSYLQILFTGSYAQSSSSKHQQRTLEVDRSENQEELEQSGRRCYELKVPRISHELEQKRSVYRTYTLTHIEANDRRPYWILAVFKYKKRLCQ